MPDPVRISGFFSSFDTEAVIAQLTQIRQIRIRRMEVEQARAQVRKELLGNITSRLASLLGRSGTLVGISSVSGKTATASGTAVSAAAEPSAALGSFTVAVSRLATATRATGSALTAAINATSPLSASNFGTTPTNGTFTIGTASGGTAMIKVGASTANALSPLASSNFTSPVTAGTFTLTNSGGAAVITIDPALQSLDDVVASINVQGLLSGVSAAITNDANGRANQITLSSSNGPITVGAVADTSNFLTATNLTASTGTTTRTSTAAFTTQMSLNAVVADINASGVGITASITNDANGRANIISFAAASAISLGNANDSSNFLTAANVLASPGTTARASTQGMARLSPSQKMADAAFFGGPPAAGAHTFTVNGFSIAYNTATDSLNDVITRINSSSAGVIARYDTASDSIRFDQTKTGSLAISLADDGAGGDFLSKAGLLAPTAQTAGLNAEYAVNGGATQYSASNSVTAAPGVTLTLNTVTDVGSPVTVTIGQNSASALSAVKAFVADFNAAVDAIDQATKTDAKDRNNAGELSGDATVRQLKSTLRGFITGAGIGADGTFRNLNEIGVGFGAPGAALGATKTLVLDEGKFTAALARDPASVQNLLSGLSVGASLTPGGTGSISGMTGSYTGTKPGRYSITDDGFGHLTAEFRPDDGTANVTTYATVAAGGSTTTLIPGMTLQIAGVFSGGEHVVNVTASKQSPMHQVRQFLETQAGAGGVLARRQTSYDAISQDFDKRMATAEARIESEMNNLRTKFRAMEQAQARAQGLIQTLQRAGGTSTSR